MARYTFLAWRRDWGRLPRVLSYNSRTNRMRLLWLLLGLALLITECQPRCTGTTCEQCMSSGFSCTWCSQPIFRASRCQPKQNLTSAGCEDRFIDNPKSYMSIFEDAETDNNQRKTTSWLLPQQVHISTRPGESHKFVLIFHAARNFPIDIYFLFDNSMTMDAYLKEFANLADNIAQSISHVSSDYMMGFGVFQDKVILPFTDTSPERIKNPCVPANVKCVPPFEFIHMLNMTKNTTTFRNRVAKTMITENLDRPEGSLDAIIQAVMCKVSTGTISMGTLRWLLKKGAEYIWECPECSDTEIGWRDSSHKLLIFASNDGFHLAGDGRLAGIVTPNDGQCHLDREGRYTKEHGQDYPSAGQLAHIVAMNDIHIVFAVTKDQISLFKELSYRIPNSIVEALTSENSSGKINIKDIIENKYKEMLSEVELEYTKIEGIDIQIRTTSEHCQQIGTNKCKSLNSLGLIDAPISFEVDVKVTKCLLDGGEPIKKVAIYPSSKKNDQMVLHVNTLCECSCRTDETKWELESAVCSAGNGTLKCGLCECPSDRYGHVCECDSTNTTTSDSSCFGPGENSTEVCSGTGQCVCGVCHCAEGYSGSFCECNDRSCGYFQRELCGGNRGHCSCGECICETDYTGTACECPTTNLTCVYDNIICSDAGVCECGRCQCKKGYIGMFCESCFLCDSSLCETPLYQTCAECVLSDKEQCPQNCPQTQLVNTLENTDGSNICTVVQTASCFLPFRVTMNEANITLLVQKTLTCSSLMTIAVIPVGVGCGVVFVGFLLLLLWKMLVSLIDRVVYTKFQENVRVCKWAQHNNMFYNGTTMYRNPLLDTSGTDEQPLSPNSLYSDT